MFERFPLLKLWLEKTEAVRQYCVQVPFRSYQLHHFIMPNGAPFYVLERGGKHPSFTLLSSAHDCRAGEGADEDEMEIDLMAMRLNVPGVHDTRSLDYATAEQRQHTIKVVAPSVDGVQPMQEAKAVALAEYRSKADLSAWCREIAADSGQRVDWHDSNGRGRIVSDGDREAVRASIRKLADLWKYPFRIEPEA